MSIKRSRPDKCSVCGLTPEVWKSWHDKENRFNNRNPWCVECRCKSMRVRAPTRAEAIQTYNEILHAEASIEAAEVIVTKSIGARLRRALKTVWSGVA